MTTVADALLAQLARPEGEWIDVGVLRRNDERNWFETLPSYWQLDERPVLGQVFEERGPAYRPTARVRLPPWFSHLLPQGRLRGAVAEAAAVSQEREYFLLAHIGGDDLPGALRTRPIDDTLPASAPDEVDLDEHGERDLGLLKFSLAGLQLKFSVRGEGTRLTVPATGEAGNWIAKLPDHRPGFDGVPEAELAGLELARAAGINVPEARLVDIASIEGLPDWAMAGGGSALLVRRFDRTDDGGRVHFEELAQILDVSTGRDRARYDSANFETVARVTAALCGPEAVADVIDRIVLNVLLGNGDAHAKNWAYRYPDGRTPELSPAYDIVPTVLFIPGDDLGLNLAGSTAFDAVGIPAFERLADRAGWDGTLGRARAADAAERVTNAWPVLGDHLPVESVKRLTARRDGLALAKAA